MVVPPKGSVFRGLTGPARCGSPRLADSWLSVLVRPGPALCDVRYVAKLHASTCDSTCLNTKRSSFNVLSRPVHHLSRLLRVWIPIPVTTVRS